MKTEYLTELRGMRVGELRNTNLSSWYKLVAIESTGYVIVQQVSQVDTSRVLRITRLWCDTFESWPLVYSHEHLGLVA